MSAPENRPPAPGRPTPTPPGGPPPTAADLAALGWDDGWAEALAEVVEPAAPTAAGGADGTNRAGPGVRPARVLQHHGAGLVLGPWSDDTPVMFTRRLTPEPTVGDWVLVVDGAVTAVLPRRSLLRRRAANGDGEQSLAANVDRLLLVCGLDRPVKDGRIQRGTAIAHDAGAQPVVVLTKAARSAGITVDPEAAAAEVRAGNPGVSVVVSSVKEGMGLDELRRLVAGHTVALLGESGAGKSSIVNALLGGTVAAEGDVRDGDAKGRHTTTGRELHLLDGGGVLIDTPGIREVGLVGEPEAVEETFAEVAEVAETCRFSDCGHRGEPGCALAAALADGTLDPQRVRRWEALRAETEAARVRADPEAARRAGARISRLAREATRRKGRR